LLLEKKPVVNVKLARLSVPTVSVNVLALDSVKASASVMVAPVGLYVIELRVTPLVVMVGPPVNVIVPVLDHVMPAAMLNVVEATVRLPVPAKVGVLVDALKVEQLKAPVRVTVYALVALEVLIKLTLSAVVGTDAPTVAALML
jgi:hypothetical protein